MTIVLAVLGAVVLILLAILLVWTAGLRSAVDGLARRGSSGRSAGSPQPGGALDARLTGIERLIGDLSGSIERVEQGVRRSAAASRPPLRPAAAPTEASSREGYGAGRPSLQPLRSVPSPSASVSPDEAGWPAHPQSLPRAAPASESEDAAHVTPDGLVESYRELIAHPRRSDINRWFEQCSGLGCEAGDDDVFQLVERGGGARLMLLPLTGTFGLVLPSALTVVDFATDYSDVLNARSAFRRTFRLEPDGRGTLRLEEPAKAALVDGVWRLKVPGALSGFIDG